MGAFQRVQPIGPTGFGDEGTYYLVQTTTPGTGVAGHAAPVQADLATKPLIHLFNQGAKLIIPDYIKVRMTAIGAGATTGDFEVWHDTGSGATTRTSGGTLMSPAINTSTLSKADSGGTTYFGAVVATSVAAKRCGHSRVRSVVPVVEDQYYFVFGPPNGAAPTGGTVTTGTTQITIYVPMAPLVIGPLHNFQFSEWGASQSGAHSFDLEFGYWERAI